ncbi:hypothetical protein VTN77DRAFT_5861 [Rasamsonia byssochlamydoides]|uniref:uncharacterized protein n=1 Tax=Rasamsonia byssochlamydoides TaxID=89139 RepID=UPI0037422C9B
MLYIPMHNIGWGQCSANRIEIRYQSGVPTPPRTRMPQIERRRREHRQPREAQRTQRIQLGILQAVLKSEPVQDSRRAVQIADRIHSVYEWFN